MPPDFGVAGSALGSRTVQLQARFSFQVQQGFSTLPSADADSVMDIGPNNSQRVKN